MGRLYIGPQDSPASQPLNNIEPQVIYVEKSVEVIKEVKVVEIVEKPIEIIKEVIKEIKIVEEKIIEKPVEVIKEVVKEVKVVEEKLIEVIKEVPVIQEIEKIVETQISMVPTWMWGVVAIETFIITILLFYK